MSNPPPPFPPGPPQPPGHPGYPPVAPPPPPGGFGQAGPPGFGRPAGAPPWQTQPLGALVPQPVAPKKSKVLVIVLVIVLLVGAGVGAFVVLSGDDDGDGDSIDGARAHDGLQTVLEDASFDDEGNDALRSCPLGNLDDLVAKVDGAVKLDELVVDGVDEMGARDESDLPGFVSCQLFAEDESDVNDGPTGVFFQAVFEPPRDYEQYIRDFAGDATDLSFEDSQSHSGGEVVLFCAEQVTDDGFTGCDADWVDEKNDIALAVFLGGDDVDADDALAAMKAVLPTMAASLAEEAPSDD